MTDETKYKLVELTKEEADAFAKAMDAVIEQHSVYFKPIPKVVTAGIDKPFTLGAELFAMKKVELPKESVESPYKDAEISEEKSDAKAEEGSESVGGKSA